MYKKNPYRSLNDRRMVLTMPHEMHDRVSRQAGERGISINSYLRLLIQAQLAVDETGAELRPGRWQQQVKGE